MLVQIIKYLITFIRSLLLPSPQTCVMRLFLILLSFHVMRLVQCFIIHTFLLRPFHETLILNSDSSYNFIKHYTTSLHDITSFNPVSASKVMTFHSTIMDIGKQ